MVVPPSCEGFYSVPGLFQSLKKAELWGVISSIQFSGVVHSGVDNLNVVRHVGCLHGHHGSVLIELQENGDLL